MRPLGLGLRFGMRRMPLRILTGLAGRRMGAPSAGAAATRLTGTSVKDNLSKGDVQFRTILELVKKHGGIAYTRNRAEDQIEKARQSLLLFETSKSRTILEDLADFVLARKM